MSSAVTPEGLHQWIVDNDIHTIRTEGMALDGWVMGKQLAARTFEKKFPDVAALTDMAFAFDFAGTPQLGWWADWRMRALGDISQRADLSTLVTLSDRPGVASVIVEAVSLDGTPVPVCGRGLLRKMVDKLAAHGLTAKASFELEFFAYMESFPEARRKKFRNLTPMTASPSDLGYMVMNEHVMAPFMTEVCRRLEKIGVPWEAWNDEAAPGQIELNFDPADPITAADYVHRAKQVLREVALDTGCSVTFMAKPGERYGSGMHAHHSLWRDGEPVFFDANEPDRRSALMKQWIAGQIGSVAGATSLLVPTINSFRRMVGFSAAPTHVAWGEQDKSAAIRTVTGTAKSTRVEYRNPSADVNPYISLAVMLASGMVGLEHSPDLLPESAIMAWGLPPGHGPAPLPNSMMKAAKALQSDDRLWQMLGDDFCSYWVESRKWEWLMFHTTGGDATATTTTDFELNRYFDVV